MIFPADYKIIDASNAEIYRKFFTEMRTVILYSLNNCSTEDYSLERELISALRSLKKATEHCDALLENCDATK